MDEAEHAVVLMFFDDQIATDSEIDDGSGDVAHVGGIVDEGAGFARSELIRRLILRGDGAKAWIAAARPPQIKHNDKRKERQASGQLLRKKRPALSRAVGSCTKPLSKA